MKYTTSLVAQEGHVAAISTTESGIILGQVPLCPLDQQGITNLIQVLKGIQDGLPTDTDTRH